MRAIMPALPSRVALAGLLLVCCQGIPKADRGMEKTRDATVSLRQRMVQEQLVSRDITAPTVLQAMTSVPRHRFVPQRMREYAYIDQPLRIGSGQTISQPYIVAFMTQALQLQPGDKVLEIGTGSGYQAAVLSEIVGTVFTIEIIPELARSARALLENLGYEDIQVREGDGYLGWPEEAPFDAIIVTAAPDHVPPSLLEQLAPHGRLVLPVGDEEQQLERWVRDGEGLRRESLLPVRFVPMTGQAQVNQESYSGEN